MSGLEDGTGGRVDAQAVQLAMQARSISVQGGIHQYQQVRSRPVPRQLPAPTVYFTDREGPLEALGRARGRAVAAGVPLVAVCVGPGGIGKSEVASRWLQGVAAEVEGPHLYADLGDGGPRTADDVLGEFLRALGQEPEEIPAGAGAKSGLFRTLTSERPVIVLLDDVTLAAQVRPLVPNSPGSVVLATARAMPQNLPGAVEVELGPMDDDAALAFLREVAGERLASAGRDEVEAVVRVCAGRPFTLYSAGRQLAAHPPAAVARRIHEERGRMGSAREADVTAVLNTGYAELSGPAAALYRGLGALFGRDFSREMAAAVAGADDPAPLLDELGRAGLVTGSGDGRYRLHELGREHARGKSTPAEHEEALRRLVEWYLNTAAEADHALMPGRWRLGPAFEPYRGLAPTIDPEDARAWLERERPALRAAVQAAAERGWADLVVQLAEAQWALCFRYKHHEHWVDVHRRAVEAAPRAADPRFEGRVRCQLGFALLELGRLDEAAAEFTAARSADARAGHVRGEATAVESLGLLMLRRCGAEEPPDLRTAHRPFAEQARELLTDNLRLNLNMSQDHDDDRAVALAWRHLGRALSANGDHDRATEHLGRARELLAALPDPYNEGKTLIDLGRAHLRADRPAEARDPLERALELLPAQDAPADRATALETLSAAAIRTGDRETAARHLTAALELLDGRDHPRAQTVRERLEVLSGRG